LYPVDSCHFFNDNHITKEVFEMSVLKEKVLRGIAKAADKAVEGACGSKSLWISYEPEMPKVLKQAKMESQKRA
jgi:cyclic lactone autoinducer peptide